jgi:large repetitive protein
MRTIFSRRLLRRRYATRSAPRRSGSTRWVSAAVTAGLVGSGLVLSGAGAATAAAVTGLHCTTAFPNGNNYTICSQAVSWTEGQPATQTMATFSPSTLDVNPQPAQFSVSINWGNGSGTAGTVVANPDGSFSVIGTATFAEEGCCESLSGIDIVLQDHGQGNATISEQDAPVVADAALTAAGVTVSAVPGSPFQGTVATFTDTDPGGTAADYTATIDWGDGSPPDQGTISAQGSGFAVSGSHTYTTAANTITVQVTDAGG